MPDLTVAAAMRPGVPSCTLRTPVMEVARRMQEEGLTAIVVASAGSDLVAGVITELDLLRAVSDGRMEGMASDVMSTENVPTVGAGEGLDEAVKRMAEERLALLLVLDGEPARPVGVLSVSDLAAYLARR